MSKTLRQEVKHDDNAPVVSVIMPAYRVAEYIGAAIDSVLNQSFNNLEIIVVNDGSPDTEELEAVLEAYGDRIIYIKQANGGPSAARNAALMRARGQFVAFLDADDYWNPNYLAEQLAFIEKSPGVDLVYTDALLIGDSPLAGKTFMDTSPSVGEVTFERLLAGHCTILLSGTVVRRQSVIDAELFDEQFHYSEDFDLWLRIAKIARLAYQKQVLLYKRIHSVSLSSDSIKLTQSALRVLAKVEACEQLTESQKAIIAQRVKKLTATLNLEQGKLRLSQGDCVGALEAISEANVSLDNWKLRVVLFGLRYFPRLLLSVYNFISPLKQPQGEAHRNGQSLTMRAGIYMMAKTAAFALGLALPLMLVRRLSQHDFGLYKQVFLIVGTALSILPLGVGMSAYYFLPRERERQGQIVFNIMLFYLFMSGAACLVFVLRPQLLGDFFHSQELAEYGPLIGVVILLWVVSSFLEIIAVARQEFKLASFFVIGSQLSKTLLLLASAILFTSLRALIYAATLQGVIQICILFVYLRSRYGAFWRSFRWSVMREQLAYALPLGVAAVIIGVKSDIHSYFVANQFDAATFAVYAIGCFQLPFISIISESVGSVMIPRVSYLQKYNRQREIIDLTAKMMRKLSAIYLPLYILLLLVGREFITVLFTPQYLASYPIFAINLTLIPLAIFTSASDPVIRAYAEHRYFLLRARVVLLVLLVAALWYGTSRFGMIGVISIAIGMSLVERLVSLIKAGQILQVKRGDLRLLKDVGKVGLAATTAGAVTVILRATMSEANPFVILVLCSAAFTILYLAVVMSFNVLTVDERETINRQLSRVRNLFGRQQPSCPPNYAATTTSSDPMLQAGVLTDKQFWDSTHLDEKKGLATVLGSSDVERQTLKSRIKIKIKALLGRRLLDYMRSYEDYLLWDVIYNKHLPNGEGLKVLEVGSAPGEHLVRLSKTYGFTPYGIEYSESGVELNREVFAANGIDPDNVIYADFLSDEVHERYKGAFDIVISRGFIEHFTDVRSIVEKHINLLAEGGQLIISIPNLNGLNYALGSLFHKEIIPLHNLTIMEKGEFTKLFDDQGISPLLCRYYGTFNFGLFNARKSFLSELALKLCMKVQLVLNVLLRLLFKGRGVEHSKFSPSLIFIGVKTTEAQTKTESSMAVAPSIYRPLAVHTVAGETK
jgi:glycosyltransferase involved in cell wall biosynthesis/O-antigen/teichoic acid export membrane protein/2-polyprenyl-3-methyl-5-hydroxy-6-metoxy-1,4-benzoquinol methylase